MSGIYAILLGDSIRQHYQDVVVRELDGDFEVWAPEPNGSDTRFILAHIDEWVIQRIAGREKRSLVHVNCGLHDLKFTDSSNRPANTHNVPLEQYKQNVQRLLETVLRQTALPPRRLIWALTTPVIDERHRASREFVRLQADVESYNSVAGAICKQLGVTIHDLHAVVMDNDPQRIISDDGVHYTDQGRAVLGRAVAAKLRAMAAEMGR